MELLAGSVNVEVDEFSHAGYLSAYPRSFESAIQYEAMRIDESTAELVDLPSALALKPITQDAGTNQTVVEVPRSPMPSASLETVSGVFVLCVATIFFAGLGTVYLRRLGRGAGSILCLWAAGPILLVSGAWVGSMIVPIQEYLRADRLNNLPPPWLDVPIRQYEDPEAATLAIMHGLIVNGLHGCSFTVEKLPAIQHEIGFPLHRKRWTEGMEYAVRTYGRDGWGREFALQSLDTDRAYRIRSAGPDGEFATTDDIVHVTRSGDHYNWEPKVESVYLRHSVDDTVLLIHRMAHHNFRAAHADYARMLTGGDLFDAIPQDIWSTHGGVDNPLLERAQERAKEIAQESGAEPLFLVRLGSEDNST